MPSYPNLVTKLESYLAAAAATMASPACKNVIAGEPVGTVNGPIIAYWLRGIRTWGGDTLAKTQEEWGFTIRVYLPLGTKAAPPRSKSEQWVAELASAIRAQLWANAKAAGEATGLGIELSDVVAGYVDVRGVTCRIADMDWWAQMADVGSITAA